MLLGDLQWYSFVRRMVVHVFVLTYANFMIVWLKVHIAYCMLKRPWIA